MNPVVQQKLTDFFSAAKTQIYQKNAVIIEPQISPQGVYQILSGSVKMTAISADGDEVVINTFKAGAFFPMGWVLNNTPNNYFYQASETVKIKRADKTDFLKLLSANPDIVYDLTQRIYRGLDGLFTRLEFLMSGSAYLRLINELIIMAKRFGKSHTEGILLDQITEKDLASQSGIARETVSREFKKLINKGLISYQSSKLLIPNLEKLTIELASEQ